MSGRAAVSAIEINGGCPSTHLRTYKLEPESSSRPVSFFTSDMKFTAAVLFAALLTLFQGVIASGPSKSIKITMVLIHSFIFLMTVLDVLEKRRLDPYLETQDLDDSKV